MSLIFVLSGLAGFIVFELGCDIDELGLARTAAAFLGWRVDVDRSVGRGGLDWAWA